MRHASVLIWLVAGWVGYALLPWYGLEDGIMRTPVRSWLGDEAGTGLVQAALGAHRVALLEQGLRIGDTRVQVAAVRACIERWRRRRGPRRLHRRALW